MGECSVPSCDGDDNIPFTCNECGQKFCTEHRLPESHDCHVLRQSGTKSGGIFSTGLQGKEGKKRGITDRLRNKVTGDSDKSKPTTNKRSTRKPQDSPSDTRTTDTNHRKYMEKSSPSDKSPEPERLADRSSKDPPPMGYRVRWATWLYRLVGALLVLSVVSVLVVGFTPVSVPPDVPPQISGPIEGAASASSAFVANLSQSLSQTAPLQDGSEGSVTESSDSDSIQTTATSEGKSSGSLDIAGIEKLVHQGINDERQSRGLSSLSFDSGLQEIARYHSKDMAENDYFAHTAPDSETMEDRYDKFGYQCRVSVGDNRYVTGAENIFTMSFSGMDYSEEEIAKETVEGWMGSSGHRENILRDYWNTEGIGVYIEEDGRETTVYVTQNFC